MEEKEVIKLGRHRLMRGDATNLEDVKKLMDGERAHMIFTDPPWNVNYEGRRTKRDKILNDDIGAADFENLLKEAFKNMNEVCLPGAMTYVVMGTKNYHLLEDILSKEKYRNSGMLIWDKEQFIVSWSDYQRQYEPIWYGWTKAPKRLHPLTDRKQSDVWKIKKNTTNPLHPTQKPIALIEKAIVNSTNPGDIVIDFFAGSGSTLIACENTGRTCYSMELSQTYCDIIVNRFYKTK